MPGTVIATHDGAFHADDVTAWAILRKLFPGACLVRSRHAGDLDGADIVFDVGGIHDPGKGRFDHHMPVGPARADGTPYSSVGLVWKHYGREFLRMSFPQERGSSLDLAWERIDRGLISEIDCLDNGIGRIEAGSFPALVNDFNPVWDSPPGNEDGAFLLAAGMASEVLTRRCESELAAIRARDGVREAARNARDPRVVVLEEGMPWHETILDEFGDVLYVVSPSRNGGWHCSAVPDGHGSFGQKKSLPAEWAGLRDAGLSKVSGVEDAVFCHHAKFVCGAKSMEGAVRLATLAADWNAPDLTELPEVFTRPG